MKVAAGRASTVVVLAPEAGSGGGGAGGGSGAGGGGSAGGRSASHPDKERYVDGHEALSPEALQVRAVRAACIVHSFEGVALVTAGMPHARIGCSLGGLLPGVA